AVLSKAKHRFTLLRFWGAALAQQERFDDAMAKYRDALHLAPDDADSYEGYADLADQLTQKRRFDDAERLYQEALDFGESKKAVNRKALLRRWGEALSNRKLFGEAKARYQAALSLDPDDKDTHRCFRHLGNALSSELHFSEAIEQYRAADKLYQGTNSADRSNLLQDWGDALLDQNLPDDAKQKYEAARD